MSITHTAPQISHLHAPSVHVVSNTLYLSLTVIDIISSGTAATVTGLYTCRLCCYCNAVFIGLISPMNNLQCLLPTPTQLTAHNLMLSTGVVQLCPTVALSPTSCQQAHLITASDIVLHASYPCAVNGLLCL